MKIKFIIQCILLFWYSAAFGAQTLEISNIKASGTGSPAIPSTNRIFYAYPGIEYNIRAGVIGGTYPYTYALSNAPVGMTIKSRTGEITWTNPTSSASDIVLTVTDSDSTQVQATWSITVTSSTSYFRFVDSSYSGSETGSISQPYSSLANAIAVGGDIILYFRGGSYSYSGIPGGDNGVWATSSTPRTWIGYPGETATMDMNDTEFASSYPIYIDNLTFTDMDYHGLIMYGPTSYYTIRRCTFNDFTNSSAEYGNQGVIVSLGSEGSAGSYTVIQDNYITNFTTSTGVYISAIGSIYRMTKLLIENNYIYGNNSVTSCYGIFTKTNTNAFTIRGNKIIMLDGKPIFYGNYSTQNDNDYLYNLFVRTGSRGENTIMNAWELLQGTTSYSRNTIITDFVIRTCTDTGPFTITQNVISNPNTNWTWGTIYNYITYNNGTDCFTEANNLTNTTASTLVDSSNEYKLQAAYSEYVGTRGWQLSDGYTPMELGELDEQASTGTTGYGITMQGVTLQ